MTDLRPAPPLLGRHADDDLVAVGDGGPRTALNLRLDAARVAAALPTPAGADAHAVLVFKSDRYAFAAALLGAWAAGYPVALPPNTRRDAVAGVLDRGRDAVLLHDTAVGLGVRVPRLLADPDAPRADDATVPLARPLTAPRDHAATVYTSGSRGQATPWPKTSAQLLGEAETLRDLLALAPGACVAPTVGPTHIYGLLFGVLLPLASGAATLRETPLLPEAVAARVRDHAAALLVTVPAHLRTFEALAPGSLEPLRRIVSSTAPLPKGTAARLAERHGLAPIEILGSTETGGMAWRQRGAGDEAWTPLPGVRLDTDEDDRLWVDSPFLHPTIARPYRTEDLAERLPGGRIVHRGRADDVVKIGGRRVSLRAFEDTLRRQPGVEDAAVLAVGDASGRGTRLVALAVAPSRRSEALRAALEDAFDPSTLPRRVQLVDALPRESNGKLQRARALRVVGLGPDGRPRAYALEWGDDARVAERQHDFEARVPERYAWYDGHFPTYPVMAGAVQLHDVVLPCVRRALPDAGAVVALRRVKFVARISPGDAITVSLRWDEAARQVDFTIRAGEARATASSGRIALGRRDADAAPS